MDESEQDRILKQIEKAKIALVNKKCFFYAASQNSVMEFMNLGIDSSDEIWPLISELLDELKPQYQIKSDFQDLKTLSPESELATFVWDSDRLKKRTTLTFILHIDHFYYFSLS